MNRDDIIRMAREVADIQTDSRGREEFIFDSYGIEAFANLVAAAERERIIAANAPEIEKVNAYIKALAQPEPYAAQAAMVDQQTQGRMYVDPVTGDAGIGTVKWDASAPLVVHLHPAFQTTEPQREWQTLTDEEMFSLWVKCPAETEDRFAFARAIEQALKEKNT